ncbi:MAG: phenylalanine--tRNA ligase subunit alpha [Corallococcus sp.]|nr:phenylalanine--tRNA ligase subunit alpha [Corallococcus sp.]MCM1359182.1 phenylalanine--tRNA ligase subunit alpha [Corallococcus sp.]MCM1394572.1 phenylalanine--tRNA ligase subunit alpha [Corallococcus sp.]
MDKLEQIKQDCLQEIGSCDTLFNLQELKVKYLGKSGLLTALLKGIKDLPVEERPGFGAKVNVLRNLLEDCFNQKSQTLSEQEMQARLQNERVDVSLLDFEPRGALHPITIVENQICDLLTTLGFEVLSGPEIETDRYNFEALNIPADHPARDMQDTFYITDSILLRTHTSPMQARLMEKSQPPIKMICPGKVFRSDSDSSHSPVFHQIEGLVVDENVTLRDLKGTLEYLAKNLFGKDTKVRFRPSYFPFTEPSVEVDLSCSNCGGKGCSLCKGTGWIEVLGAGMVNPAVLENCGIDSKKYTGYAFGWGLERVAMIKYGIPDIRLFYENDKRFLKQFSK